MQTFDLYNDLFDSEIIENYYRFWFRYIDKAPSEGFIIIIISM